MRIKIIESYRSDKGYISAGTEQEVDDEAGMSLIRGGLAEEIGVKPKLARKETEPETDSTESDHGDGVAA